MTWIILTFVFLTTTIAGMYTSWNLLKKQEITEDRLSSILKEVKDIDRKGMFEADDEVGTIFSQINSMIITLNDFLAK